jgi:protein involved in ribonucleotide reduction
MRVNLYIRRNVKKVWGARYTLGAHYLSKNMVIPLTFNFNIKNDETTWEKTT